MTEYPFTAQDLEALKAWDTPTICNGLEIVAPERRAIGFTVEPMVVVDRKLPPIVGLARTGLIRAKEPPRGPIPPREDWYDYVAAGAMPTIGGSLRSTTTIGSTVKPIARLSGATISSPLQMVGVSQALRASRSWAVKGYSVIAVPGGEGLVIAQP